MILFGVLIRFKQVRRRSLTKDTNYHLIPEVLMKKFIQLFSMLSLALVFGAAAAMAQTNTKVNAEIPFDFNIGGRILAKGSYQLDISKYASGAATVTVIDRNGVRLETVVASLTENSKNSTPGLEFKRDGESQTLTGITTPAFGVAVAVSRPKANENRTASVSPDAPSVRPGLD